MYPQHTPKCANCNSPGLEHVFHAFVECRFVKPIWTFFSPFFNRILKRHFSHYQLALGSFISADISHDRKKLALLLTVIINKYIWWARNRNKHDNLKSKIKRKVTISVITEEIRRIIQFQFNILMKENRPRRFLVRFCIDGILCTLTTDMKPNFTF